MIHHRGQKCNSCPQGKFLPKWKVFAQLDTYARNIKITNISKVVARKIMMFRNI